jgi:hypothetical protein
MVQSYVTLPDGLSDCENWMLGPNNWNGQAVFQTAELLRTMRFYLFIWIRCEEFFLLEDSWTFFGLGVNRWLIAANSDHPVLLLFFV